MPHIALIAAVGLRTRAVGKDNDLLWRIPGDLPRFKELTMGHPIIMGARTFDSIGRPLPGRTNIVLTHDTTWYHDAVIVCHSVEDALRAACARDQHEVFVIGGGMIYAQTIERADRLYLTLVDDDTPGDVFFPDFTTMPFTETAREDHLESTPPFSWVTLTRV